MTSKILVGFRCVILTAVGVLAATSAAEAAAQTKTVAAGPGYAGKSGWHRFLFGNEYRVAWGTPITVEVLDLQTEAGGLTPVRRVGGLQTKGLALRGKDGLNYTFRGLEKDTSHILEADLRGTIAERLLQDQMAAQHPASEVVARAILDAVGIPCPHWRLVVLPDDPALGELRKDFAGAVGVFGEYPTAATPTVPGFVGATEIIDHLELYKRLEAGQGDRADTRALLKARLVDIFMGDWDRHRKQWRWARVPGNDLWQPIPEDRDQALARYEGVVLDMVRGHDPRFQKMRADYPNVGGLTSNGWEQDRRLLVGLTSEDFAQTANALRGTLTNDVIDAAVRAMPKEWFAVDGERICAELKSRRDALPEIASKFYRHLAGRVDVYMTEQPERVEARRSAEGDLAVSVAQVGADGGVSLPYFQRTFKASETEEVRFYALGGNDTIAVTGDGGGVHVRVVGGAGNDVLDASGAGNAKLSDSAGNNRVVDADLDAHPYIAPPPPRNAPWVPPRDWSHESWTMPWVAYSGDLGVFLGMGLETQRYSFRKHPFGSAHIVRAGYAFGEKGGRLDYRGLFSRENRSSAFIVGAYVSAAEVLRFYGFGNETANIGDEDFYRVSANQAVLFPAFLSRWGKSTRFAIGPLLKYTNTNEEDAQFINEVRPYGVGEFGELGVHGTLNVDTSDSPVFPRKGIRFSLRATLMPEIWDVQSTFGSVGTDASAYLSAGRRLTLAVRAGGKRNFGDYPFFDAATIGGGGLGTGPIQEPADTVRGFRSRRFMGDASLYGNAELRLRVSHITLVLPGNWGVNGFVDSGRVFLDGEDSNIWHTGVGGGIWLSLLSDRFAVSGGLAHSDEDDLIYFKGGFSF